MTDWSPIETRGYVIVRDWLDAEALVALRADYAAGPPASEFDFGYKPVSDAGFGIYTARVSAALDAIGEQTSIDVDALLNGFYFATRFAKKTSIWHQDYDAYYKQSRDHVNYLNFYVPIEKPDRDKSNVSLVPFDVLTTHAPDLAARLRGGGANFVTQRGADVTVENTDVRTKHHYELGVALDLLAETPALGEGDLLLMRGDLLHRSQDLETPRVACSVRFGSSRYGYKGSTGTSWFRDGRRAT